MDKSYKFLGICFIIGMFMLSVSLVYSVTIHSEYNRYRMHNTAAIVIDSKTGDTYFEGNNDINKKTLPK